VTASLLSLAQATSLEEHLPQYPGVVVVAGHDHWLRQPWAGRRLHPNTKNPLSDAKNCVECCITGESRAELSSEVEVEVDSVQEIPQIEPVEQPTDAVEQAIGAV